MNTLTTPKALKHNKRRNAGLLYEFLVRSISSALVEGDKKRSSAALKLLKKHFKPGTELYKEFRLINSLMKTTVSSEHVAASILTEAKTAARAYDAQALDREKSILIKQINHGLNDSDFYDQQVKEYTMYATIQTLLNSWRNSGRDLSALAEYEDKLMQWLVSEKQQQDSEHQLIDEQPGTARLLMKVMTQRLNEKYSNSLSDAQKSLIKAYVFSSANSNTEVITKKLTEIKGAALQAIDEYYDANKNNEYISKKLVSAKEKLLSEDVENVDDDKIARFLLYTKLNTEIKSGGGLTDE